MGGGGYFTKLRTEHQGLKNCDGYVEPGCDRKAFVKEPWGEADTDGLHLVVNKKGDSL